MAEIFYSYINQSFRRCNARQTLRSGFTHTKTTKCELASLKQHILLHVFAHINLFPPSANGTRICIASTTKRLND